MRLIETHIDVAENRQVFLQLPGDVALGRHRMLLMIDEPDQKVLDPNPMPIRWEGDVLVFDGIVEGNCEHLVEQARSVRIAELFNDSAQP